MEISVSSSHAERLDKCSLLRDGIANGLRKCRVYEDDIEFMTQQIIESIQAEIVERAKAWLKVPGPGPSPGFVEKVDYVTSFRITMWNKADDKQAG